MGSRSINNLTAPKLSKIKQNDINRLIERYNKTVELEMHLQSNLNDIEAKADHLFFKESIAKKIAELRFDRNLLGLDINCLNLLDSIERIHILAIDCAKSSPDISSISENTIH